MAAFKGASAIVTGGVSGLGEATSFKLAEQGVNVVALDINEEKGNAWLSGARQKYPNVKIEYMTVDICKEAEVQAAVDKAVSLGPLRVVVNCAGIGMPNRIVSQRGKPGMVNVFNKVVAVNLFGTYLVSRCGAAAMTKSEPMSEHKDRGVIINVASVAAFEGQIGQVAYSASKGGVVAMTLPMARDLAMWGIRVCTVAPGIIDTPMMASAPEELRKGLANEVLFPKRLGNAEEFGELAWTIVKTGYLNGETIRLDGGIRMQPASRM